jgi:hypothetical protein
VGNTTGVAVGDSVGAAVGDAVGAAEETGVGTAVGAPVAATITSYALNAGSIINVHWFSQQKHCDVTVFQLKKKGVDSPPFREQYV